MKKRILNHFGLKVLSLIFAILVWVVVANVDDYKTTKQISGIVIEFVNGNAITEKSKVYEVPDGATVDIVVKGRRSVVEKLTNEDFKAVADLSKMSVTNAVAVEVSAISSYIARDLTISYNDNAVIVAVENKIEKQFPITVRAGSDVADGYAIRSKSATPNLITVKGAESVVNNIAEVVVDVETAGANHNLTANAKPVFLDSSGKVIDATKFEYDVTDVNVTVEIMQTKQLSVKVKTTGEPHEGYTIASIDYQPTTILVVGETEDLARVDEIVIDDVDVTQCNRDLETSVVISDYLPSGIMLAENVEEIMIKVMIERVIERTLTLDPDDINIVGKEEGYQYTIIKEDGPGYTISAHGLKEDVDSLKITNLIPSIDVSGYGPGIHTFTVSMRDIKGIEIPEAITVQVEIVAVEPEEEE
ncbi:MAG: CdaR family protein [Clostridium sp.]|nr:CdaR family protein [Clostridium sp.]